MSSGQKHRDPYNFPRMKWRAWKRLTPAQRWTVLYRSEVRARFALLVAAAADWWPLLDDPALHPEGER